MDVTWITDLIGNYAAVLPMLILIIGALILPATNSIFKKRLPVTAIAMVLVLISLVFNILLLTGTVEKDGVCTPFSHVAAGLFAYDDFSLGLICFFRNRKDLKIGRQALEAIGKNEPLREQFDIRLFKNA